MNHTPAPWTYNEKRTRVMARDSDIIIADLRGGGKLQYVQDGAEIVGANGRLLAAAPDLLETVISLVMMWKNSQYTSVHHQSKVIDDAVNLVNQLNFDGCTARLEHDDD